MIRVNLLPTKAAVRVSTGKTQLIVAGVIILVSLLVPVFWASSLNSRVGELEKEIEVKKAELKKVEAARKKLDNIQKLNEQRKKKLDVINNIEQSRTGPLWLMDQLTDAITRFQIKDYRTGKVHWEYKDDKVFLTNLKIDGSKIEMEGMAINNTYLVAFMNNLKMKSDVFKSINLEFSDTTAYKRALVRKFKLTGKVNLSAKPQIGGPTVSTASTEGDAQADGSATDMIEGGK